MIPLQTSHLLSIRASSSSAQPPLTGFRQTTVSMAAVGTMQLTSMPEAVHTATPSAACIAAVAVASSGVAAAAVATAAAAITAAATQQALHAVTFATVSAADRQHGDVAFQSLRSAHAVAAPLPASHHLPAHKHHHAQRLAKHDCTHGPIAHLPLQLATLDVDAQLAAVQVMHVLRRLIP